MGDLTTLASAKAWLPSTGTADDALLTRLISAVSVAAQQFMDRQIASASYAETRHGNDKTILFLKNGPVTAVTSLVVDSQTIPARSAPGAAGFTFDDVAVYLEGYGFNRGVQNVVVGYTAGYSSTPADLEQAVLDIVAFKYQGRGWIGQSQKALGHETVSFFRDVPPDALRVLQQYRRAWMPS